MAYSSLLPFIAPDLPDCPEPLILRTLHQIGRDFCLESEVWRKEVEPVDLEVGELTYEIVPDVAVDDEPEVVRIVWLKIEDVEKDIDTYTLISPTDSDPAFYVTLDDSLEPAVDVTDGLEMEIALAPSLTQDILPSAFLSRWSSTLVAGVLARLQMYDPRRYRWGDYEQAAVNLRAYQRGIGEARRERFVKGRSGTLRAVPREGWAV